jgi:signal transduction histidine kinase
MPTALSLGDYQDCSHLVVSGLATPLCRQTRRFSVRTVVQHETRRKKHTTPTVWPYIPPLLLLVSAAAGTTQYCGHLQTGHAMLGNVSHTRCFIRDDTSRQIREARAAVLLRETKRSLEMLVQFMSRSLHHLRTPFTRLAEYVRLGTGTPETDPAAGDGESR